MNKGAESLGIGIRGGTSTSSAPGIFVENIVADGVAAANGMLRPKDRVSSMAGWKMVGNGRNSSSTFWFRSIDFFFILQQQKKILEVNGVDLSTASKVQAVNALKNAGETVVLIMGRSRPTVEPTTHM